MSTTRRLWLGLAALLIVGFGTLLWMGGEIYRQAPKPTMSRAARPSQSLRVVDMGRLLRKVEEMVGAACAAVDDAGQATCRCEVACAGYSRSTGAANAIRTS